MKKQLQLSYWNQRFGRLPVALVLLLLAGAFLYLAYAAGVWHAHHLKVEVAEQRQQLQELYNKLDQLEYQRNVLQVELDIETSANQSLQKQLTSLQDENYSLRESVAFYQKIMAPELQQGGVIIESLAVSPNIAEQHFHFSLALLQVEQRRSLVEGEVGIELVGRINNQEKRFDLLQLANLSGADQQFMMRYFTLIEGDFFMPEEFIPERLEVITNFTKGASGTLERTFFWKDSLRSGSPLAAPNDES